MKNEVWDQVYNQVRDHVAGLIRDQLYEKKSN
jgi:hypothetical protein